MAAYFVVDVQEITDPQAYAQYRNSVDATMKLYNGRFIVRGGEYRTIEGEWQPERFVIVEFDNVEAFERWYNSEEYQKILPLRLKASSARAIIVQGV